MKSYHDILQETFRHPEWWNYYNSSILESLDIFDSKDCYRFANDFFHNSRKATSLNTLLIQIDKLESSRCQHIVYTYLLGIYFYNNSKKIKYTIDQKINRYNKEFPFIWFLICLFHDLGSSNENACIEESITDSIALRQPSGIPRFYKDLYKNYYEYRKSFSIYDHGITAGLIMYRDLCKIRRIKAHSSHPLFWGEKLESVYNLAAWIVLCHNIWYAKSIDKTTCESYKEYKLDPLIIQSNEYKIHFSKYPLLFLFCLVDSIEAIKVVKSADLLNMIYIDIKETSNNLKLQFDSSLTGDYKMQWMNKVNDLNNWLTCVSEGTIHISNTKTTLKSH